MTCRKCGNPIPDGLLGCPGCAIQASQAALKAQQAELFPLVIQGRLPLDVYFLNGVRHVRMFGVDFTYCHLETPPSRTRLIRLAWLEFPPAGVCDICRVAVVQLAEQAQLRQGA